MGGRVAALIVDHLFANRQSSARPGKLVTAVQPLKQVKNPVDVLRLTDEHNDALIYTDGTRSGGVNFRAWLKY